MYCSNCGAKNTSGSNYCCRCGSTNLDIEKIKKDIIIQEQNNAKSIKYEQEKIKGAKLGKYSILCFFLSFIFLPMAFIGLVLLIYAKVLYPNNKYVKIAFWLYLISIILLLLFIIIVAIIGKAVSFNV